MALPARSKKQPKPRLFDRRDPAFLIQYSTRLEEKPDAWFRSEPYLASVRKLPCRACGRTSHVAAAHLRKGTDGCGEEKPSDFFVNPLCDGRLAGGSFFGCHERQHAIGEVTFWTEFGGVDVIKAEALTRASQSHIKTASAAALNVLAGRKWGDAA